jgi:hypothetical protein
VWWRARLELKNDELELRVNGESPEPIATASSPALIVIHGIGTQKPGDTLRQAVKGLLSVCPDATLADLAGVSIQPADIDSRGLQRVHLRQGALTIRLFEVYWADLLPDQSVEKTFDKFDFEETTWFPLFNWRAGLLPRDEYPGWLMALRTLELWLLQVTMSVALEILTAFKSVQSTVLDRTAADVWHYAHSLGGEFAAGSWLTGVSEQILDRVHATWTEARSGGPVHLMGHSLGSVVAYHSITRRLPAHAVGRLITVGSPLEKVRFLWAKLFPPAGEWTCDWTNYLTPSDPVSGSLKRFAVDPRRPIRNVRLWGLGGYGQAHIGYFRDPRVACDVAGGLGAVVNPKTKSSGPSWFLRRAVDLAVPLGMLALVAAGGAVTAAFFGAVIWITAKTMGLVAGLFSSSAGAVVEHGWRIVGGWLAAILWVFFTTKDGYQRAATRHRRRWLR